MAENVDDLVLKQLRLIPETLGQIEGRLRSVDDKIDDLKTGRQRQTGIIMALAGYIRDLKADLARRSRSVHEIPFDAALQPGGRILLRKLSAPVRQAYLEVAADIMAGVSSRPAAAS